MKTEHIVNDSLGFTLDVTITIGAFEKLGSHITYEDHETGKVAPTSPHKINIKEGLDNKTASMVSAHEAYHLFKSIRHLITADEETETEVFGELVSRICELQFAEPGGLQDSIAGVRAWLPRISDDARRIVFDAISDGYCKDCGRIDPKGTCQCWNDE